MLDILFARTIIIISWMLLITALMARTNKTYETKNEMRGTLIVTFGLLFAVMFFDDQYPINLILVALFSAAIGRSMWPTITFYGEQYQLNQYLKKNNISIWKDEEIPVQTITDFEQGFNRESYSQQRNNIIFQAILGTVIALLITWWLVMFTTIDFGFLDMFLFIILLMFVIINLLNYFFFKSSFYELMKPYIGVVIFVWYLLYDFNKLEKLAGDTTRSAAISVSVSIYLDIINIFMYLLQILSRDK
jgi:FtsH-binding integral membrane protein